ncbi:uncharacterized protein [Dermacentor albipictus]|uniref:uncharacterized protein n=1 Tax=Dermacentor albipictus TaxID=60249 RepID=UPI0038FD3DF6
MYNRCLLFVQLVPGLLLYAGPSFEPPGQAGTTCVGNATAINLQRDSVPLKSWDPVLHHSSSTCADAGSMGCAHDLCPAPPLNPAIKDHLKQGRAIGHGGTHRMRSANNPLIFILQVRRRYGKCIRSNDPFLLVLPCPRLCAVVIEHAMHVHELLLLGGDIETNPGPEISQQLKEIAADIKEIKESRLAKMDKKLDQLTKLEEKVDSCQEQIANMNILIKDMQEKIDDLENRSRRNNLLIYGLPEVEGETPLILESAVNKNIIVDTLELKQVAIERIHRIGRGAPNKVRPVILKLLDSRDKSSILKRGYKLKGTGLSIAEDFSKRVRDTRRKLWNSAKTNRQRNEKVSLVFDKLYINNRAYVWSDEKEDKVPLNEKRVEVATAGTSKATSQLLSPARLHIINPRSYPSPKYPACPARGTAEHLLWSCSAFHTVRERTLHSLGGNRPGTLQKWLDPPSHIGLKDSVQLWSAFLDFFRDKEGPGRLFAEPTSGPLHLEEEESTGPPPP